MNIFTAGFLGVCVAFGLVMAAEALARPLMHLADAFHRIAQALERVVSVMEHDNED